MDLPPVDPNSEVAPFEQVRRGVLELIDRGTLRPADRLPTVRRLAGDLDLAPNTVARAYRELELAGVIETDGRRGTFVASPPSPERTRATEAARRFLADVRALGVGEAEALAIVRHEIEAAGVDTSGWRR